MNDVQIFVTPVTTTSVDQTLLSFEPVVVKHGEKATMFVTTAAVFLPTFLVIDPDCASFFDVESLRVGMERVIYTSTPATLFLPLSSRVRLSEVERRMADETKLSFPTCLAGNRIVLEVKHRDSCEWHHDCLQDTKLGQACSNRPFRAALYGLTTRER